jgi:hypothetical protein
VLRYSWAILSLGFDNTGTWFSRMEVGYKADYLAQRIKNSIAKSKEVKTGLNLAASSKKGYGSKSALLSVMIVMMMMMYKLKSSNDGIKHS